VNEDEAYVEMMRRFDTMHKGAAGLCRKMIENTLKLELHPKMGILAMYHFMRFQVRENLRRGNFDIEDIKMSKAAFDIMAGAHEPIEYEVGPESGFVEVIKH
jgi:hypothetical protein